MEDVLSARRDDGVVYLVGAGPGGPGLITVRGARLLELADVVIYDALANPRLLSYCPQAETVYVGKRAAAHTLTQDQINELLVKHGRAGKKVVRLKGGDPYVFGRGGEEAEALHSAGVRFEVVPGITAAIAAPAYAGIPVTHRDFNSSFTFITGHEKDGEAVSDVDWSVIARLPCFAFYMGAKSLPTICQRLIDNGMNAATPAATIQWGTHARQRTVVGTIADIAAKVQAAEIGSPAITIVGKGVSLRDSLNWFETRPLFGQTIVVTRTRQQASELSEKLESLGAEVIEAPTIELTSPASWDEVDEILRHQSFNWVIFTSANGVSHTKQRLFELNLDARIFAGARIAAIGNATTEAVRRELCLQVDLCPESFVAEALADELANRNEIAGKRHLLLRADIARPVLRERLEAGGSALVRDVAIYETKIVSALPPQLEEALDAGRVAWITFTSSSTVKNFVHLLGANFQARFGTTKLASIGPITSTTMRELGLEPTVEAKTFNVDGLVEKIQEWEATRRV
ncbi:MAG: uroporphyrinogen-III C-methyltransferase [Anaerolineae bacterium]|nr:uroporphyrinogen-III C-methyltransferase [Phycisphaerae bacterium]